MMGGMEPSMNLVNSEKTVDNSSPMLPDTTAMRYSGGTTRATRKSMPCTPAWTTAVARVGTMADPKINADTYSRLVNGVTARATTLRSPRSM